MVLDLHGGLQLQPVSCKLKIKIQKVSDGANAREI